MFVNAVHLSLGETCYSVTSDFIISQIAILPTTKITFHRRVVSTTHYPREQYEGLFPEMLRRYRCPQNIAASDFFRSSGLSRIAGDLVSNNNGQARKDDLARVPTQRVAPPDLLNLAGQITGLNTESRGEDRTLTIHTLPAHETPEALWEEYLKHKPSFAIPSTQTRTRYYKSFMKNGRIALVHSSVDPEKLHIGFHTAMLALGALYLFETESGKMLYEASRFFTRDSLATSHRATNHYGLSIELQLTSTFLLLSEYVKLAQPSNIVEELRFLDCELSHWFHLSIALVVVPLETELQRDITTEMTRRSFAFAFCALTIHSYLSNSPMPSFSASRQLQLPCLRSLWNGLERDYVPRTEDNTAVAVYEKLLRYGDELDETNSSRNHVPQLATEVVLVFEGCCRPEITQRLQESLASHLLSKVVRKFRFYILGAKSLGSHRDCVQVDEPAFRKTPFLRTYTSSHQVICWSHGGARKQWCFILCAYVCHRQIRSQAERELLERVGTLVTMMLSSLGDLRASSSREDMDSLSHSVLTFWSRVLQKLENKPFSHALGKSVELLTRDADGTGLGV
ncbi:hypothetical protein K456DRAFT_41013 [Colletotrichum gloeosporioides 23]|nr:hypothetical protein K456DRAFT_41013 [Colletotrichum gloeosporioides 23]